MNTVSGYSASLQTINLLCDILMSQREVSMETLLLLYINGENQSNTIQLKSLQRYLLMIQFSLEKCALNLLFESAKVLPLQLICIHCIGCESWWEWSMTCSCIPYVYQFSYFAITFEIIRNNVIKGHLYSFNNLQHSIDVKSHASSKETMLFSRSTPSTLRQW